MTISRRSDTGDGSVPGGFCQAPIQRRRWTQGLSLPAQCFTVRLDVHQSPGRAVWCYSFEVSDPHTREMLATVVEPARDRSTSLPLASIVSTDLRGVLLELTDPEPF